MLGKEELYGWKGFRELTALFAFQGTLGVFVAIALWRAEPAAWSAPILLTLAGGAALTFWQWHLLVPTLVRFELVFMPKVERRLLFPLFVALIALVGLAAWLPWSGIALRLVGVDVLVLSLVSFAVAGFLFTLVRDEQGRVALLQQHFERFATSQNRTEVARVELYVQQRAACLTPGISIRGIEFPGLTSRPWHEPASLSWVAKLEEAYPVIRDEILAALAGPAPGLKQYRYLGVSTADWQSLMLFREADGFLAESCAKLPKTVATLRALSVPFGREVMVSVIKPRSHIPPHRDSGNMTLTCQLGIQIPKSGCSIRVGRERRAWQEGKCVVFDTTYEHEVSNDSDEVRVVLLFDFLHPDLTATERAFLEQLGRLEYQTEALAPTALDAA